jgi:glucose-6-phosphate isomerase
VILDWSTGRFAGQLPQTRRTLSDLATIFKSVLDEDLDRVVYETFGCGPEVEGSPKLLYATTVLQSGSVNGEFFMTRGHFHERPDRGELMFTMQGSGKLVLMDRDRKTWTEEMAIGSVHDIDGTFAHRVVNTGSEPLVFLVAWMSDCGHDYASIAESGFGERFYESGTMPANLG